MTEISIWKRDVDLRGKKTIEFTHWLCKDGKWKSKGKRKAYSYDYVQLITLGNKGNDIMLAWDKNAITPDIYRGYWNDGAML